MAISTEITAITPKKPWWKSATIASIVVAFIGMLMAKFGIDVPDIPANADAETIKGYINTVAAAKGNWQVIVGELLSAVGTISAIYNRATASTSLTTSTASADVHNEKVAEVATTSATVASIGLTEAAPVLTEAKAEPSTEATDIQKEVSELKAEVYKIKAAQIAAKKVTKTTKNDSAKK